MAHAEWKARPRPASALSAKEAKTRVICHVFAMILIGDIISSYGALHFHGLSSQKVGLPHLSRTYKSCTHFETARGPASLYAFEMTEGF